MEKQQTLTFSELEAKWFFMNLIKNATSKPCDIGDGIKICATLPRWYDDVKFKRGQKYFSENRFGILTSNMCGLLTLLADPKGLDVLDSTGRSSTIETAKQRYVSTIMHTISWYDVDLGADSKLWASLNRVRKMHLLASNSASEKKIGLITQSELVLTTFGFMGFALIRPQFLGIRCDNKEYREGFIHFWAVMGHMIGLEEQFNMCLFDIDTVENICLMILRYFFIPTIQLESPKFQEMTKALLEGLSEFMPNMSYDIQMFLVKRIIGVPGYQYGVDVSKEKICREMFSAEELSTAREVIQSMYKEQKDYLQMYGILFGDGIPVRVRAQCNIGIVNSSESHCVEIGDKKFHWIMGSKDNTAWSVYLNDTEFYELSKWDQLTVRLLCFMIKCYENSVVRFICEMALDAMLFFMRRYFKSMSKKQVCE